jgi:hypothetical protein
MRTLAFAFLVSTLMPLAGCNLYFSGGDDDPPCDDWGGGGLGQPAELLRNPETGVCEAFGVDWPTPCDGTCGPCAGTSGGGDSSGAPAEDSAERAPNPGWGACESICTGLDEDSCLATDGCRGIYGAGIDSTEFLECWATGPDKILIEDCTGLDSYTCSQSDTCIAVHQTNCDGSNGEQDPNPDGFQEPACTPGLFISCGNEGPSPDGCYGDNECDPGSHCNAAEICLPPPGGGACPEGNCDAVPTVCYGYCVPDNDPGECEGEVLCDSIAPNCPVGTTPGIANGCWTGECISLDLCPSTACTDLSSELACISRIDCNPYYIGEGCECGPDGCVCTTWTYDSCNSSAP